MRPSIASAINSQVQMHAFFFSVFVMSHTTLVLAGVSSYISSNIRFPFFITKNATVTAYLLESSLARFKKSCLLFYSDKVFARIQIKNENIQLLLLGSLFDFSSVRGREGSYSAETFPR